MKMNLKKSFKSGFTLIELLVVVAIIGILASVVLASLNTARAKGADAAIKANLANIRAQAELVYDPAGTYGTVANAASDCVAPTATSLFDNSTIKAALASAASASGGTGACFSSLSAWSASYPLKTNSANSWCVDSTGASKSRTGNATTTAC